MLKRKISDYLFSAKTDDKNQPDEDPVAVENDIQSIINSYIPDDINELEAPAGPHPSQAESMSEVEAAKIVAKQLHIDYVKLSDFTIDPKAVSIIPVEDILNYNLLPIGFEGGRLVAAMSGKTNIAAINELYVKSGYYIVPVVVTESDLEEAIGKYTNIVLAESAENTIQEITDEIDESEKDIQPEAQKLLGLEPISEVDVAMNIAKQLHIDFVDLSSFEINPQALSLVSNEHIRRYNLLPIDFDGERLVIAMSDPTNIFAIDDLRVITGYEIVPVVVSDSELQVAINRYSTSNAAVEEAIENIGDHTEQNINHVQFEEESEEAPVVKLVNLIVTEAFREGASDIFIEPQENEVRVRYRVDGVLQEVMRSPKHVQAGIISRIKIMAGLDIAERRLPQDGRFGLAIDKKPVDFRVATLPTIHGEQVVLRVLEKDNIMLNLDDLGFLPDSLSRFKESFSKPYGAILITGPTGSGKTTTLYAVLNILNVTERNLITVEDPVEYRLPNINQVQVNTKAGLTFPSALRSILRHDPDIIMIGEIRDEETAIIAIESALTGHLVLSTLHTNTASATLTRLIEMGIEPFLVSSAVDCIVAQRLARKLCTRCKEPYKPTKEALLEAGFKLDGSEPKELHRARGCKFCGNTGYRGRIGLYEVMIISENIERLLVDKATVEEITRTAISEGMRTLHEDGLEKAKAGITSIEEIARVSM